MSWGVLELEVGQGIAEAFVLVVGHPALRSVGGHAGLVADAAPREAQLVLDEILDDLYLVGPAGAEVAAHVVLVQPGLAEQPRRVDDEGKNGGQPLGGDDHEAAPGHEGVEDETHGADARAEIDVDIARVHPGLDIHQARLQVYGVGVVGIVFGHGHHLLYSCCDAWSIGIPVVFQSASAVWPISNPWGWSR